LPIPSPSETAPTSPQKTKNSTASEETEKHGAEDEKGTEGEEAAAAPASEGKSGKKHVQGFLDFAQRELGKMNQYKAPRDKLICVLNCCKVIFGAFSSLYPSLLLKKRTHERVE
jgi:hypothetical protein